ncbi:hypothetical protein [Bradyrhizobium sp. LA7.1]|uniref:hypothetical protein n=1 Tax=Bradyrhizobium sp. LA7.1 TaxID=3156324 RepID=UPI003393BB2D
MSVVSMRDSIIEAWKTALLKQFSKALRSAVTAVALCLVSFSGWAEISPTYVKAGDKDALYTTDKLTNQQFLVTHIAGREYRIPYGYIQFQSTKAKDPEVSMLLLAQLPDFESCPLHSHEPAGWGSKVLMLIDDAQSTTTLLQRFEIETKRKSPLTPAGEKFGLQSFVSSKGTFGRLIEKNVPVFKGQSLIQSPTEVDKAGLYETIYFDSKANPSVYIVCTGDTAEPVPACFEHFSNDGLLYEVSFGKEHLKDWKSIKDSTAALLQHMSQ